MGKNTSISLGDHFEGFISGKLNNWVILSPLITDAGKPTFLCQRMTPGICLITQIPHDPRVSPVAHLQNDHP
ncbi:MAG: hypothetical protein FJY10_00800 [Bacteroidetes bacterium]|nr:hypothetical protein [Bacteroidota bacterium]